MKRDGCEIGIFNKDAGARKGTFFLFIIAVFFMCSAFTPFHKKTAAEKEAEFYKMMWAQNTDGRVKTQQDMEKKILEMALALQNKRKLTPKERKILQYSYRPMPVSKAQYKSMSADIKRKDQIIVEPKIPPNSKIKPLPEPRYIVQKYNKPAGSENIDLTKLKQSRQINSQGVLSPTRDKLVYTAVYYEPSGDKVSSEMYFIPTDSSLSEKNAIINASVVNRVQIPLVQTGMDVEYNNLFRTLTLVDWSQDGNKIAVKERIGSSHDGIWQTNLWVFDFTTNTAKNLTAIRDGVKYMVAHSQKIALDDYRWDILPLGWDAQNPDRIYVCAYAYTKGSARFMGLYSIDYKTEQAYFVSQIPTPVEISTNGLIVKKASSPAI